MTLDSIIRIAQAYAGLGMAVQEQIAAVCLSADEHTIAEQNFNALRLADDRFLHVIADCAQEDDDQELANDVEGVQEAIEQTLGAEDEEDDE